MRYHRAACLLLAVSLPLAAEDRVPKRVAGVVTVYRHNTHADVIVGRLLNSLTLDGKGPRPALKLVSLYVDQVAEGELSRPLAKEHGFAIHDTVRGALTLGTDRLAVEGVVIVAEHGKYPDSETGQTMYPKRRFFEEVAQVFRESGRSVPVFSDKHVADNWQDAKWIYDTARELKVPLMTGSSLPTAWRVPEADVERDAPLAQLVAVAYGSIDAYGFHGLEMAQCLAERRKGGETGVKAIQCLSGEAVWKAADEKVYDAALLDAALARMTLRKVEPGTAWRAKVRAPLLFVVDYADGFRMCHFLLNGAAAEFVAAWKDADGRTDATLFRLDEDRPFMHFAWQVQGIERLMHEGMAPWPVERTLLTSGILDAGLISKKDGGKRLETPWLDVRYSTQWNWEPPQPLKMPSE